MFFINSALKVSISPSAAAFLGLVGGVSALFGFSKTLATAKKADSKVLQQAGTRQGIILMDEGTTLAMRALGWGTLYAVLGTGAFCYGFWKLSGAKDVRCISRIFSHFY